MQRPLHISPADFLAGLDCRKNNFTPSALVCGQVRRARRCCEYLDDPVKIFSFLGHTFWTGTYKGVAVTVGNGGLYAPDTAIVSELLCTAGIKNLFRLGSCGALDENMALGDCLLAEEMIRGEGTTPYYVDETFVPRTNERLNSLLAPQLEEKLTLHRGRVWTTDALFRETSPIVNSYIEQGACAVDMVSSALVTIAGLYKCRSAVVLIVSDNLITGEKGFSDARILAGEDIMIRAALESIVQLHARGGEQ